ncbi:MAG: alcohol dehydrogenase catalytic domain-containing protein [Candidatus Methanomethylicia archaeon]
MKAGVYYGPLDIRCVDIEKPKIGFREILVEMRACGICGSDLMDWYLKPRAPIVLGHEPTGVIVEADSSIEEFNIGDRVFIHHHVACMKCYYCINGDYTLCSKFRETHIVPGGFAEYFKVPEANLIDTLKLPDNVSFEEGALIEPLACCIRAVRKVNIKHYSNAAVIGLGPTGLMIIQLLKNYGVLKVLACDLVDYRVREAKRFGADIAVSPEEFKDTIRSETSIGVDVVFVTAPSIEAYSLGIDTCRSGGILCIFAPPPPREMLQLDLNRLFFSEVKIIPSYSTSHIETRIALSLIEKGKVNVKDLITHRFTLEEIAEAYKVAARSKNCLKVVVTNSK